VLAAGWLVDYVELGLSAAVGAAEPPGTSEAQHARLATLRPHERDLVARIEAKLPLMPDMDLKTLVLLGVVVIGAPRALAVVKLRKHAAQAAAAPGGAAPPPAAPPAPAAQAAAA